MGSKATSLFEPVVIGMTRTQIKPSRTWFNLAAKDLWPDGKQRGKAPPFYVWSYTLKVIPQQKDEYSFWNWDVERADPVMDAAIIKAGQALHDSVKSGQIREATDTVADTEGGDDAAPSGGDSY